MSQTLLPDGEVAAGGWTALTLLNTWQSISDGSDTSYIYSVSNPDGSTTQWYYGSFQDPASGTVGT